MDSIQNSAVDDEANDNSNNYNNKNINLNNYINNKSKNKKKYNKPNNKNNKMNYEEEDVKYPHQKYSKLANWHDQDEDEKHMNPEAWHELSHDRIKRATRAKEENKNTCSLYIQTDPLIWRHVREGIVDVSISHLYF